MANECRAIEAVAGAIALNEASDAERERYRLHLSVCGRCLDSLGGERDIERVASLVGRARDAETWAPDAISTGRVRQAGRRRAWTIGFSALAAAVAVSLGAHGLLAVSLGRLAPSPANPIEIAYDGQHVTIEHRARSVPSVQHVSLPPGLLVERTIVHLTPPAAVRVPKPRTNSPRHVTRIHAPVPSSVVAVQTWERQHPVAPAGDTSGVLSQNAPPLVNHAESLAAAPEIHDVAPLGGESAIVPHPAPIAYAQGAEGTTAYAVDVDERGAPVKCTIDKSSGYLALDDAVCAAAMKVQYAPRTIGGRPVPSTFHDAITFRVGTGAPGN